MLETIRFVLGLIGVGVVTFFVAVSQWTVLKTGIVHERHVPRFWHWALTKILGIRVHVEGEMAKDRPLLIAANHISWTDILVVGSVMDIHFIAKADIAGWPIMGKLCRLQRTVFVDRGAKGSSGLQVGEIANRLADGDAMVLFAEGTTGDGSTVLPFKSTLFGAAQLAVTEAGMEKVAVQPLTIVYTHLQGLPMGRRHRPHIAWIGRMPLFPHLRGLLREGGLDVEVRFGEPVDFNAGSNRKKVARLVEDKVRAQMSDILRHPPRRI